MKRLKIIILLTIWCNVLFGNCIATYNNQPTCEQVEATTKTALELIVKTFEESRTNNIIDPTEKQINEQIKYYNELNSLVYKETQTILELNNQIAIATEKQEQLLKKLADLKDISVKSSIILQKSNLSKNNEITK